MTDPLGQLLDRLVTAPGAPLPEPLVHDLVAELRRGRRGRDAALRALAEELSRPGEALSRWALAGVVAERLRRFEGVAWPRVRAGYRAPQGVAESLMCEVLRCGPAPGQRCIWNVLPED